MKRGSYYPNQKNLEFCAIAPLPRRAMNHGNGSRPARECLGRLDSAAAARAEVPSWKRIIDIICILAGSVLWVPAGLLIALFIKIVSPGPVLFKQERIGHMSKKFLCLKFRTMTVNANTSVHQTHLNQLMTSNQPMKKLDGAGDARLIPGGLWLRSLGVDELPQLINILRGEMSLVGPRPCVAYEYEMFQPHHRQRCQTLPGLTGLWQVNGKNRTTFGKMMELDLVYVEKKSLFLDLKIMAFTVPAILIQVWDVKMGRKAAAKTMPVKILEASSASLKLGGSTISLAPPTTTPFTKTHAHVQAADTNVVRSRKRRSLSSCPAIDGVNPVPDLLNPPGVSARN